MRLVRKKLRYINYILIGKSALTLRKFLRWPKACQAHGPDLSLSIIRISACAASGR